VRLSNIVKIAVTAALLAVVFFGFGPRRIASAFTGANAGAVAVVFCITPLVIFLKAVRWHLLASSQIEDVRFRSSLRSYLAGLSLAVVTPLSSGELARGVLLGKGRGLELTGLTLLDKVLDLAVVGAYGLVGLGLALGGPLRLPLCALGVLMPLLWGISPRLLASAVRRAARWRERESARALTTLCTALTSRIRWMCVLVALLNFGVYFAQMGLMLWAFAGPYDVRAASMLPFVTLCTIIPYAVGGLGVRELAAGLLLDRFAIDKGAASAAVFAHFVIVTVLPGLIGAFCMGQTLAELRPWIHKENAG